MKKNCRICFLIYMIICLIITVFQANQKVENTSVVRYGTSTSDTIELSNKDSLEIEFELTENFLYGISLKFQTEDEFLKETLHAQLYELETSKLLDETDLLLRNERIQNKDNGSFLFLPLSVSDKKGTMVRLSLYIDSDSMVFPSFVISDNSTNDSVYFYNDEVGAGSIVFRANYRLPYTKNYIKAILSFILLTLIGLLLFGINDDSEKKDYGELPIICLIHTILDCLIIFLSKHKKVIGYFLTLASSLLFLIYVQQMYIQHSIDQKHTETIYKAKNSTAADSLDFTIKDDELSALIIDFQEDAKPYYPSSSLHLYDCQNGKLLCSLDFERISPDKIKVRMPINHTIENSKSRKMKLCVTSDSSDSNMLIRKIKSISAEYHNISFMNKFYLLMSSAILIIITILYWICFVSQKSIAIHAFIMTLLYGSVFCFMIGLGTVPDEPSHIDTVYQISNEWLGTPQSEKPGYIYKRVCDIDNIIEEHQSLNVYHYERLIRDLFDKPENTELVECAIRSNLGNAGKIFYLPQVLGLSLSRLLGLGYMASMMFSRMVSLLSYAFLSFVAIRKIPYGKTSLAIISMLPISIQQAASFSYDAMINAVAFLFVAYTLSMLNNHGNKKFADRIIVILTTVLMASVKGGVYIPLCMLPLLIFFIDRNRTTKELIFCISLTVLSLFSFLKSNLSVLSSKMTAVQGTVTGGASSSEVFTLSYLIHHPKQFAGLFINTFYRQGDSYLRNILGGNLAWREVNISWFVIFAILIVLLLSCLEIERKDNVVTSSGKSRLFLMLLAVGTYITVEMSMLLVWTPVTFEYITGVQGRYFLPVFILVILSLRNRIILLKKNIDYILLFVFGLLYCIVCLQILQFILK